MGERRRLGCGRGSDMARGLALALGLGLAMALAVGACTPPPPLRESQPRIISLNPCTDALLVELGDADTIVALSGYSRDPRQSSMDVALARRFGTMDGTMEAVVAARPTLILSGSFTPQATRSAYARLGLRLEEFGMAATVEESEGQIRRMAALLGHPERGKALVARIQAGLRAAQWHAKPASALVWHGGGLVAGPNTLISELLLHTGFSPISATRHLGQGQFLPLEAVVADPPAAILTVSRADGGQGTHGLSHPVLAGIKAMRRYQLDPTLEYCGGPTIIRAATRLAQIRRAMEIGQ
jgi:iron complex transport system substrate-binding protein